MTDKELVNQILAGNENAWHQFVKRYSDVVFYIARKWTWKDIQLAPESEISIYVAQKTGKNIKYCEKTVDTYLWIFKQLRNKLRSYKDLIPLDDFVWSKLNSHNLFKDYLIHIHGKATVLPAVIKRKCKVAQRVCILLRMKKSDEQILKILRTKYKTTLTLEKLWEIEDQIYHNLSKAGLFYLLIPDLFVDSFEQIIPIVSNGNDNTEEMRLLYLTLEKCLRLLRKEERHLIFLFYFRELTADQIMKLYQRANKKLLGQIESHKIKTGNIYKFRDKILKKLRECINS